MNKFKNFFDINFKYQDLFESSFDKLYSKGYFGEVNRVEAKSRLNEWFMKFIIIVENKMEEELIISLCSDNKENHLWFEAITGHNLKNETYKVIREKVIDFCNGVI